MAYVTPDKYSPYPRVCDVCGQLRSINTMRKLDGITWVCDKHQGERTRIMLDLLNAHARPPQTWPNLNAKPQNPEYPNTLEPDEGAAFEFIDRQIQAQCRYELVASGSAAFRSAGDAIQSMGWAARYLYNLIQQGTRTTMLARARTLLGQAADFLLTRQYGSLTGPFASATRANNAYYGGFLESGATVFVTGNAAIAGLALLYAYRVLGTISYRDGARAAASYLRNVQAIGSNATQHTSSDSAGTSRLYTGAVCSEVSTVSGADPGQRFYSNHLFYPGDLTALEMWSELKTTDGDQSIGATTAVDGFDTTPAQLMSQSIADMRDCWSTGITDSTGTLVNGLSITTPREFFNAYPASKTGFTNIVGTGLWEYVDGGASDGTQISAQNFARALASLYAYEGALSQETTILAWLRGFTSNADFETPANTSDATLARTTTGTYDPTICLATLLQVRDPDTFADTTINASSLYDWGAFGLLANLLAATNMTSFKSGRLGPLNVRQRFDDGTRNDGLYFDRIELRGLSGLTYQTAFSTDVTGRNAGSVPYSSGSSGVTAPTTTGLVLDLDGAKGLSPASGTFVHWLDQAGQHQDIDVTTPGAEPTTGVDTVNGVPAVTFPLTDNFVYAGHSGALKDRNGVAMPYTHAITVYAVIKPKLGASTVVGGPVFATATQPNFECLFDVEAWFTHLDAWFVFDNLWKLSGFQILAPDSSTATWNNVVVIAEWKSSGYPNLQFAINGGSNQQLRTQAGVPTSSQAGGLGVPPAPGFVIGNCWNAGGAIQQHNFHGSIPKILVYDWEVTGADRTQTVTYLVNRFAPTGTQTQTVGMVNDLVRAAQYANSMRLAH